MTASHKFPRPTVSSDLTSSVAPRGNPPRPTIYGPLRAVCFTEQPLLEFAKYVQIRASDAEVTGYAVAVHREDLFAEGGMPVISGLSSSTIEVDAKAASEDK